MSLNIIDIAKFAGVSKSTVSRYLNNGYVGAESREKIKKVIEETGFRPQSFAQTLRTGKTNLIGVIVPKINTEAAPRVIEGITEVLAPERYDVLIANTNLSIEKEIEYLKIFKNKQVDGIIFMATKITSEHIAVMNELTIPIVVVAQRIEGYPSVYHDDYNSAKEVVKYLVSKGHENIGFIGVYEEDVSVGYWRRAGFIDGMNEAGLQVDWNKIKIGDFSPESGYKAAEELMKSKDTPTALFAVTDNLAFGAMDYLNEKNIRIPEDVAIVSIGDSRVDTMITPKLTSVHYYYKTSGKESAKIILELLRKNIKQSKNVKKNIKLSYRLIERNSV